MGIGIKVKDAFRNNFENNCLKLIVEAYQSCITNKLIYHDFNENDITTILVNHMCSNTTRLNLNIFTNVEHKIFDNKVLVKGFSDRLSRIDISFACFNAKIEYLYYMEAKNLRLNDAKLKRRYIKTGINNMLNGKYPNGCILGYILEGNSYENVDGINKLLVNDKREKELVNKVEVDFFDYYYESYHTNSVTIKHLMFCFTNLN
jgi:hypothetical protein